MNQKLYDIILAVLHTNEYTKHIPLTKISDISTRIVSLYQKPEDVSQPSLLTDNVVR